MTNELNNLRVGEREVVITETCAVTVERAARGAFATVTDAGYPMNGEYAFATLPSYALEMLMDKIAAGVAA
jgi:hypothetical protein